MALKERALERLSNYTSYDIIALSLALFAVYVVGNAIYQLHFSPLSEFPGPKLAAITLWYEIYYDVLKRGRYWAEVKKMHEKYGPIVRISPYELHVSDPSFMDTLYTRSAPHDKYSFMTAQFGTRLTTFSTDSHHEHRIRRAAINAFFSKQRVVSLQDSIWGHVDKLCKRFEEYKAANKPIPTGEAFSCLTADIITQYSLGVDQKALDDPDFAPLFTQAVKRFSAMSVYTRHMPWIHKIINAIPPDFIAKYSPEFAAVLAFRRVNDERVREVFARKEKARLSGEADKETHQHTVFDDLLDSDLPPKEKDFERLSQESQLVIGAGLDTTGNSINAILFHLLDNPRTYKKLKAELAEAMPDPYERKPLLELDKLPYLTAVINEALRLSNGLSFRNARLAHTPMVYKDYVIPPFSPVGMSAPFVHSDETIFPDANSFIPERWINSDGTLGVKTSDGRPLDRFLIAFGRGARQCVGINLARGEMAITIAAMVRRFDMELYESSRKDVDLVHDLFLPGVDQSSKGVHVLVK